MIGDCQCYFNGTLPQNLKHVDKVFEEVRSIVLHAELVNGSTIEDFLHKDVGFELIKPLIQKQYNFQNGDPESHLSYGVVNGFSIPNALIKTVDVPEDIEYISLAIDGYSEIFSTLAETEAELQRLLELDPLCIKENMGIKARLKGNSSYDDRTYIKLEI